MVGLHQDIRAHSDALLFFFLSFRSSLAVNVNSPTMHSILVPVRGGVAIVSALDDPLDLDPLESPG